MSVTLLEVLQNAEYNIGSNSIITLGIGKSQLHNAIVLLEKGYTPDQIFEEIMGDLENVDDVPENK